MTTLKDVAFKANVSKMTVSRVINHPELVTDELKELVYKAMAELDYKPNVAAKALAKNKTLVVKLLILEELDVAEPHYMHLMTGIARALDKYQYALQLVTENTIDSGGSDGYIIAGTRQSDYEWIQSLKQPVVIFGENTHGVPFVDSNNYQATAQATQYAIQRGYEHIVFVGIDIDEPFEQSREKGYLETMLAHNKDVHIYHVRNSSSFTAQFLEQLTLHDNTCFICASDRIGVGIERALLTLGKKIPHDYGIIGFDGVFLDRMASLPLTTMKQDIVGMGEQCAEQLMHLINHKPLTQTKSYFDAELVVRESTK
ncbi:MAG: LacI family DNA-binding transcriptional regulator [Aerococcaceae bacterium]|nr:LacI family DNA-binding transcriptional regulator [Aerococcaceae bacterium]